MKVVLLQGTGVRFLPPPTPASLPLLCGTATAAHSPGLSLHARTPLLSCWLALLSQLTEWELTQEQNIPVHSQTVHSPELEQISRGNAEHVDCEEFQLGHSILWDWFQLF